MTGRIKHCNKVIYYIAFFDKCSIDINVMIYQKFENFRNVYHFTLTLNENAYTTLTCFGILYLHITTNESSTNDVFRGYRQAKTCCNRLNKKPIRWKSFPIVS